MAAGVLHLSFPIKQALFQAFYKRLHLSSLVTWMAWSWTNPTHTFEFLCVIFLGFLPENIPAPFSRSPAKAFQKLKLGLLTYLVTQWLQRLREGNWKILMLCNQKNYKTKLLWIHVAHTKIERLLSNLDWKCVLFVIHHPTHPFLLLRDFTLNFDELLVWPNSTQTFWISLWLFLDFFQ